MPGSADRLAEIMSQFIDDPESSHPYFFSADRLEEYTANEDEWLDPDVEVEISPASGVRMPGMADRSRGRKAWWAGWVTWLEVWGEYRFRLRDWTELGDDVLVDTEVVAAGQLSGAPASITVPQIFTIRDGRIAAVRMYGSRVEAIDAARERGR